MRRPQTDAGRRLLDVYMTAGVVRPAVLDRAGGVVFLDEAICAIEDEVSVRCEKLVSDAFQAHADFSADGWMLDPEAAILEEILKGIQGEGPLRGVANRVNSPTRSIQPKTPPSPGP